MRTFPTSLCLSALTLLAPLVDGQGPGRERPPRPVPSAAGSFEIVSCSLGCTGGIGGLSCGVSAIHRNEEVRITFSRPVDLASAGPNTFRVLDNTGNAPPAAFTLEPGDPNTLVWRPRISFDSAGNPVFGLDDGRTYLLSVPGTDLDPLGPHLTSVDGLPNRTRLQCVLVASLGVQDLVPGRPLAKVFVEVVRTRDPLSGEPTSFVTVPADGAVDVSPERSIEIVFADFMNPATLANPVTGTSSFLHVWFDPDGNLQDVSDQIPVPGLFSLSIDAARPVTRVRFTATGGLPHPGASHGRVVVELSPLCEDLGANRLANPGRRSFTTSR